MVTFDPNLDHTTSCGSFTSDGSFKTCESQHSSKTNTTSRTVSDGFGVEDFNFRFFNFNMANNPHFSSLAEIQGPAGVGSFNALFDDPFSNGNPVDVAFATLVETRITCAEWIAERARKEKERRDALNSEKSTPETPCTSPQLVRAHSKIMSTNARRQSRAKIGMMRGFVERLASSYNGNLKSLIACDNDRFEEDTKASLFGRLTEVQIRGITVPNPKKAFVGRSFVPRDDPSGIRFCLVGAHFPITLLAAAIDDPGGSQKSIAGCKQAFGRTLRKILVKASRNGLLDERTVLIVQGDLNSRTVLNEDGMPFDVLLEFLNDNQMQAELCAGLNIQSGKWHEICRFESSLALPVTYKFQSKNCPRSPLVKLADVFPNGAALNKKISLTEKLTTELKHTSLTSITRNSSWWKRFSGQTRSAERSNGTSDAQPTLQELRVSNSSQFGSGSSQFKTSAGTSEGGDCPATSSSEIFSASSIGTSDEPRPAQRKKSRCSSCSPFRRNKSPKSPEGREKSVASQRYRAVLQGFGKDVLHREWALNFDAANFKSYRFPASADRVIYWAPDCLAERMEWILPHGGYEVNNSQLGSDHKPVSLDAVLRVSPPKEAPERQESADGPGLSPISSARSTAVCPPSENGAQSQGGLLPSSPSQLSGLSQGDGPDCPAEYVSPTLKAVPSWLGSEDVANDEDSEDGWEGQITSL